MFRRLASTVSKIRFVLFRGYAGRTDGEGEEEEGDMRMRRGGMIRQLVRDKRWWQSCRIHIAYSALPFE